MRVLNSTGALQNPTSDQTDVTPSTTSLYACPVSQLLIHHSTQFSSCGLDTLSRRKLRETDMDLSPSSGMCWHQPGPACNWAEGASFIFITPGKDFKSSQLFFRKHQVPLALPAVPLWSCQHTNLLSLIPLSCCRALCSSAGLRVPGQGLSLPSPQRRGETTSPKVNSTPCGCTGGNSG